MSRTIDQRVVEMQFDNRNFESNVKTSMSTIDKLKQSLNFTGAAKGLENVGDAAKKVNMTGLGSAIESVRSKFSALEVIGVTALANITNSAVNAGKRVISALTIDPIKTGFEEYETQINAVQTILANTQSKGSTLTDVNKALDELNTYADKTIYNFTEMTRNIGTFTAAGVDLDKSVTSIKGIANLAAVSGSNTQQASTAMYQLSQALAAGKVQLMDWNSVVNAGMGGELFQNALKRTATQMGTNVDALIQKYGSFRESLTKGNWLTAEVLTETLTQLSGAYTEADLIAQGYSKEQAKQITELAQTAVDAATKVKTFTQLWDTLKEAAQSGWTQSWEILIGDFEEAKELLTWLSDKFGEVIGQSADARNALLYDGLASNWKKLTDQIADAGINVEDYKDKVIEVAKKAGVPVEDLVSDYGSLEKAFKNGAIESKYLDEALVGMTGTSVELGNKLSDLRGKYKTSTDILNALKKAGYEEAELSELRTKNYNGEFIALNDLSDAQLMSIGYTAEQVEEIRKLSKYAELAGGSVKEFTKNIAVNSGRENLIDAMRVSIQSLIDIFGRVGAAWREVFPPTTADQLYGITEAIRNFAFSLRPSEETLDKLQRTFRGLFSILGIVKQAIFAVLSPIGSLFDGFGDLSGGILDVTASIGDYIYELNKSIETGKSFSSISDIITSVTDKISDALSFIVNKIRGFDVDLSGIGDVISSVFKKIGNVIKGVANWIRENISIGDIFAGLAGGGIFVLAKKLGSFIDKIKELFDFGGKDRESPFSDILDSIHGSLESFQNGLNVASLVGIATAVMLLTSSLRKISEIDPGKIAYSLVTIRLMISALNGGFKSLVKTLTKFNAKGTIKASLAMIAMAEAINILASAMEKIAELSMEEIAKGLLSIGVMLLELSASIKIISNSKGLTLRTSVAILALAKACEMLANALSKFSTLSWDEIARGLIAMGGALGELVISLSILSKVGGFGALLGGTAILIAVQSLDKISENLERLGSLSWGEIRKGLSAMGGALLEFTIALGVLSKIGGFGSILGGTAILIAVQSLDEISENLKRLGDMSWDEIGKGLTAMGGALAEVAVVSGALGKIAGFSGIIGSGAILIVVQGLGDIADALQKFGSMSWSEIGRGLTAMGAALAETGLAAGLTGFAGLSGLFGAGAILVVIQGLDDLAIALQKFGDMSWDGIGRGLTAMAGALAETGLASALTGFAGLSGIIGGGTILLTVQSLGDLADALKKFGSMNWDEIERGLAAMGAAMGETALGGLLNTFSGIGATAIATIAEPLGDLADSIKKWEGINVPDDLGDQIGSLASGIMDFTFGGMGASAIATAAEPVGALADSIKKWKGVTVPDTLGDDIGSLADGIKAYTFGGLGASALSSAAPGVGSMADAVKKWSSVTIPEGLKEGLTSIADGIKAFNFAIIGGWTIDAIKDPLIGLADAVKTWSDVTIPSDIDESLKALADGVKSFSFAFVGGWSLESLGTQLASFGKNFKIYADNVKEVDLKIVSSTNSAIDSIIAISEKLPENKLFKNETWLNEFGEQLSEFGDYFSDYYTSIRDVDTYKLYSVITEVNRLVEMSNGMSNVDTKGMTSFSKALAKLGKSGIDDFINEFENADAKVNNAVNGMLNTLSNSISSGETKISSSFSSLIDSVLAIADKKQSMFDSAGKSIMLKFVTGFQNASANFKMVALSAIASAEVAISNKANEWRNIGENLTAGMARGIRNGTSEVVAAAKNMAESAAKSAKNALKIKSPSKVFTEYGEYVDKGFIVGLNNFSGKVIDTVVGMSEAVIDKTKETLGIHSPSDVFKEEVGEMLGIGMAQGIEDSTDQAVSATGKMGEEVYDKFVEWIDQRKEYNNLSLEEELYAWQQVQKLYAEGTEERIEADKRVYEAEQELIKEQFEFSKNWIEKKKQLNELSLIEEYAAWKRVQERYEEGSEQRIEADEEVLRVQEAIRNATEDYYQSVSSLQEETAQRRIELEQEYYDKVQEVNDRLASDIQALEDEYERSLESRTQALYDAYGLFDKVEPNEEVSGSDLLGNLQSQIDALKNWTNNINSLAAKGIDSALLEELREMGPSSAAQIEALNKMTSSELNQYVALWREKYSIAKSQATIEMEGLRADTQTQIQQLRVDADRELAEYRATWNQNLQDLNADTAQRMSELKTNWLETIGIISTETTSDFTEMVMEMLETVGDENKWSEAGATIIESLLEGIDAESAALEDGFEDTVNNAATIKNNSSTVSVAKKSAKTVVDAFNSTVKSSSSSTASAFSNLTTSSVSGIRSKYSAFVDAGRYLVEGFANGITSNTFRAQASASAMASAAYSAAMSTLNAHSPSRLFEKVGTYVPLGFAQGISKETTTVEKSASSMAESAIESTKLAIAKLVDVINGDIDTQPTIRPVLDLSDVETKASKLNTIFTRNRAMTIGTQTSAGVATIQNGETVPATGSTFQFTQNNYSPKALSRVEIYRQTKNQFSAMERMVNA